MKQIYIIGGSTCCGKTSVAMQLAKQYGLRHYKLDDYLDLYMEKMAKSGNELCRKALASSMEEMWMRPPQELCQEELEIYRGMIIYAWRAIDKLPDKAPILAEGAGFLPELVQAKGIDRQHYVCVTPTRGFQLDKYSQRSWISHYLKECSDPEQAFSNWMERDALFALQVEEQAKALEYEHILVDGARTIEDIAAAITQLFGLQ